MPIRKFLSIAETLCVFTIELYKWSEEVLKGNFTSYEPLSITKGVPDNEFNSKGYTDFLDKLARFDRQGFLDSKYCFMTPRFLFEVLRYVHAKYAVGLDVFTILNNKMSEVSDVFNIYTKLISPSKTSHFNLTLGLRWNDFDTVENVGCIPVYCVVERYGFPPYESGVIPSYADELESHLNSIYKDLDYMYTKNDVLLSVAIVYCTALVHIEGQGSTRESVWMVGLEEFIYDSTFIFSSLIDARILYSVYEEFCVNFEFDYSDLDKVPLALFYNYIIEYLKREFNISEDVFDFDVLKSVCAKHWSKHCNEYNLTEDVIYQDVINNETILKYSYGALCYYAFNFRCGSEEYVLKDRKGTLGYLELLNKMTDTLENKPDYTYKGTYSGEYISGVLGVFLSLVCNYEISIPIRSKLYLDCFRLSMNDNLGGTFCTLEYINKIRNLLQS